VPTNQHRLGKEFIGVIRDQRLPRMKGRAGAVFAKLVDLRSAPPNFWRRTAVK
jgi:hypothetical protein